MGTSDKDGCEIGCIIIVVAFILVSGFGVFYTCQEREKKQKREDYVADSIRCAEEREKFVRDSIESTPEYQDSVRREDEEFEKKWNAKDSITRSNTLVITCDDSVYHYDCKCEKILFYDFDDWAYYTNDKEKYRLTTEDKAISKGYKLCEECERMEWICRDYENGELIRWEDIDEYVDDIDEDLIEKAYWKTHDY